MNIGEVEIELDGEKKVLRPTLGAAKRVNAAGGFSNVINKLLGYDLDYYVTVISAGLDRKPQTVEEAVFKTGLPNLLGPLTKFVVNLSNGGKPPPEDDGKVVDTGEE